jgi:hypothetical protein
MSAMLISKKGRCLIKVALAIHLRKSRRDYGNGSEERTYMMMGWKAF